MKIFCNIIRKYLSRVLCAAAVLSAAALSGCTDSAATNAAALKKAVESGRLGLWKECEDHACTVLKSDPVNPYALLLRSLAAEHQGKLDIALASARQASENAPDYFPAQYSYGRLLAQQPEASKTAIQVLERALKLRPGNRNTLLLLGQCSSRLNDDKALEYYQALPQSVQQQPEILTRIAIHYLDRRDRDQRNLVLAYNALRDAYRKRPDNPVIVLNTALFLDHYAGNRRQAIGFYNRYLDLTKHNPELNPTRAQVTARKSMLLNNSNQGRR